MRPSIMTAMAREIIGVVAIIFAVQFSTLANTTVKMMASVPIMQLMQARFILQWLVSTSCCVGMRLSGRPVSVFGQAGYRLLLTARACCYAGALGCLWSALALMPVGEVTAITYLNPVLCGTLAWYFLKEQLGGRFAAQAMVSCVGVAFVVNPFAGAADAADSSQERNLGIMLAACGCVCFALNNCLTRLLAGVHPLEIQVYSDMVTAWFFLPIAQVAVSGLSFDLSAWGTEQVQLLVLFTAFGLGASFFLINAYSLTPAGKCAVFSYLEVPSSFISQVVVFNQIPSLIQIVGSSLVVGAAVCRLFLELRGAVSDAAIDDDESDISDFVFLPCSRQTSPALMPSPTGFVPPLIPPSADQDMLDIFSRQTTPWNSEQHSFSPQRTMSPWSPKEARYALKVSLLKDEPSLWVCNPSVDASTGVSTEEGTSVDSSNV